MKRNTNQFDALLTKNHAAGTFLLRHRRHAARRLLRTRVPGLRRQEAARAPVQRSRGFRTGPSSCPWRTSTTTTTKTTRTEVVVTTTTRSGQTATSSITDRQLQLVSQSTGNITRAENSSPRGRPAPTAGPCLCPASITKGVMTSQAGFIFDREMRNSLIIYGNPYR